MSISTSLTHFSQLRDAEKQAIVKRSNLLRAYIFSTKIEGPRAATKNIVSLSSTIDDFTNESHTSTTEVVSVFSERDFKFSSSCWSKVAISACSPWVSVSVEAEQPVNTPFATTAKQTFMTASCKFPFVTFAVDPSDLVPNPAFVEDVLAALDLKTPASQSLALAKVFNRWGHVIGTRVDIGCCLSINDIQTFNSKEEQIQAEHQLQVSLYAKDDKRAVTSVGGDPRIAGDLVAWINSINDASTWSIIDLKSVVPVTELLEQSLQDRISQLTSPVVLYYLPGRLSCFYTPNGELSSYIEKPIPIDLTRSFTISGWHRRGGLRHWMTIASVESPSANNSIFWVGVVVGVHPGVTAVVSVNPETEDGRRVLPAKTPAIDHEWQHFAFVMRVNAPDIAGGHLENLFMLYINGCREQDMVLGAGLLNLPNPRLCIGRRLSRNLKTDNFDGQIEDLKLVQGALTQTQIAFEASQSRPHVGGYFTDTW